MTHTGRGVFKSTTDGTTYDGEYAHGLRHGAARFTFQDGSWFEGNFRDGERDGFGREFYGGSGKLRYEGRFKGDRFGGQGRFYWADGSSVEGEFVNGLVNGRARKTAPDGTVVFQGEFRDGTPVGRNEL